MAAERRAIVADESGNASDPLRVLAGLSGSSQELLALERSLRASLKRHGVAELKWSSLRTKASKLRVAREFLALALDAAAQGRLWIDLLVFDAKYASSAWESLDERGRWLSFYLELIRRARSRNRRGRWSLYPDERTGMPWARLKRQAGLKKVNEASSADLALVQLADLLAGLIRFSREPSTNSGQGAPRRAGMGERARAQRRQLLDDFFQHVERLGLGPRQDALGRLKSKRSSKAAAVQIWELKNLLSRIRHGKKALR